jgi:Na+-transporting methylmalonyl-CoA/oxaloacetate decarboxylase gamma subunit
LNVYLQGLSISIMGIVITFLALGIFILIMIVLQRFFPPVNEEEEAEGEPETVVEDILVRAEEEQDENAVVTAIAAALAFFKAQEKSASLGDALREGHSGWWSSRRAEANTGRIIKR